MEKIDLKSPPKIPAQPSFWKTQNSITQNLWDSWCAVNSQSEKHVGLWNKTYSEEGSGGVKAWRSQTYGIYIIVEAIDMPRGVGTQPAGAMFCRSRLMGMERGLQNPHRQPG